MNLDKLSKNIENIVNDISLTEFNLEFYRDGLKELQQRLNEGKFHLAVLGQFKRGKSTLVNTLIGYKILPSSVIPLTAIPTYLYYSENMKARVIFDSAKSKPEEFEGDIDSIKSFIEKYVTEENNPKNKYHVLKVELYLPSKILKDGFVIIDTPGIGSTHKHNTEMTLNFLPQCDGALFVTSVDPPITEVEIDFLRRVKEYATKIYFLLNKIDYLDEDELDTSIKFLHKVLNEQVKLDIDINDILPVSAKKALNGVIKDDERLIKESNFDKLQKILEEFLLKEKTEVLQKAIAKKTLEIVDNIIAQLNILINSFKMPVDELEEKIEKLSKEIENILDEKVYMGDMLKGDQSRIEKLLDEETEKLRQKATKEFIKEIEKVFDEADPKEIKEKVQKYLEEEIPPYFEREFGKFSKEFNKKVSSIMQKYEDKANELIEKIREHAMKLMNIEYVPSASKEGLKMRIKPYWVVQRWETTLEQIAKTIVDTILPKGILKKKLFNRFCKNIELLINSNIENLHWSIFQGIKDTFRQFMYQFDLEMERVIESTKGAVEKAFKLKKDQSVKVEGKVKELQDLVEKMKEYRDKIENFINGGKESVSS